MDYKTMLTPIQNQLSNQLYHSLKERFSDIELVEIIENPFERDSVWMRIIPPADSARSIQFGELAADMTTDILVEHDCDIVISFATLSKSTH
jgi:hypothetical protein